MNNRMIILIAVGVAILVGAYFLFSNNATAPTLEETMGLSVVDTPEEAPDANSVNGAESAENESSAQPTPAKTTAPAPQPRTSSPTPSPIKTTAKPYLPYNVVVTYDGGRFIPDEIKVIEGGTVNFVNTGDTPMWIASNHHPTHAIYPVKTIHDCGGSAFDQCEFVEKGGTWSFTFDVLGTHRYHNHMRGRDDGAIYVMTEEEYLKSESSPIL